MKGVVLRRSLKTTLGGLAAVLTSAGVMAKGASSGNFDLIIGAIPSFLGGLGLIFARDDNVTSEEAGAK